MSHRRPTGMGASRWYKYTIQGYFSQHFRRIEHDFSDVNGIAKQFKFL